MLIDVVESVAVKMDDGGVHGDERGHVGEVARRALDHVVGPGVVVVAGAALRALHPAVAGKEVAAEALGDAVRLVRAHELFAVQQEEGCVVGR